MKNHFTSIQRLTMTVALLVSAAVISAKDIHVSTSGSDDNVGTEDAPLLTIHKAVELVAPGDRILIHEGTYTISERIKIPALATTAEKRCEMRAWPDDAAGKVIIDGSAMNHTTQAAFKMGRCIYVNHEANYWTFYGLVLQHAEDNGMKVEGSYNIIERCVFRWNNDTGLQIGMFKDFSIEETKSFPISGSPAFNPGYTYCRYNKVINCDAYENYTLADGNKGSVDIAKIAKGTYCEWDVLEQAGLADKGTELRHIELLNNNSGGEVRLYDMYIRVPDRSGSGITTLRNAEGRPAEIRYYSPDGSRLKAPQRGFTIVRTEMNDGTVKSVKMWTK